MKFTGRIRVPEKLTASFPALKLPLSGGYEEGYADGRTAGYTEGEKAATAAAEAHNAAILTDCNAVLPDKGVETADTLEQVPQRIEEIPSYADGYDAGLEDGNQQAVENLPNGFIKIDPTWTNLTYFCAYKASLVEHLKYSDTANVTNFSNMFVSCPAKTIPSLNLQKATNVYGMFVGAHAEEIGELNVSNIANEPSIRDMFKNCSYLKKVCFVPGCIKFAISFAQSSKLEDVAIQSIIDGLADLTGKTAQTLTIHATVGAKLTQAQKDAITAKNWTLVY